MLSLVSRGAWPELTADSFADGGLPALSAFTLPWSGGIFEGGGVCVSP